MTKTKKVLSLPVYMAIFATVAVLCVVLDQLTKYWIFDLYFGADIYAKPLEIIPNFFYFDPELNDGAAFGGMKGDFWNIFFFVMTLLAMPIFCWLQLRSRTRSAWGQIGFAFVIGGTIGNFIDRMWYLPGQTFFSGWVRDFIYFPFFPAVFNVADSFLVVGVIMGVLAIIFFDSDSILVELRAEHQLRVAQKRALAKDAEQQQEQADSIAQAASEETTNQ